MPNLVIRYAYMLHFLIRMHGKKLGSCLHGCWVQSVASCRDDQKIWNAQNYALEFLEHILVSVVWLWRDVRQNFSSVHMLSSAVFENAGRWVNVQLVKVGIRRVQIDTVAAKRAVGHEYSHLHYKRLNRGGIYWRSICNSQIIRFSSVTWFCINAINVTHEIHGISADEFSISIVSSLKCRCSKWEEAEWMLELLLLCDVLFAESSRRNWQMLHTYWCV